MSDNEDSPINVDHSDTEDDVKPKAEEALPRKRVRVCCSMWSSLMSSQDPTMGRLTWLEKSRERYVIWWEQVESWWKNGPDDTKEEDEDEDEDGEGGGEEDEEEEEDDEDDEEGGRDASGK